jgi:glycine hydroxymethyltransferase
VIDVRTFGITGKEAQIALDEAGITTNKNTIPNDPQSPFITSGIRIGTPAITTRGMKEGQMLEIAQFMATVLKNHSDSSLRAKIKTDVKKLTSDFEIYPNLVN